MDSRIFSALAKAAETEPLEGNATELAEIIAPMFTAEGEMAPQQYEVSQVLTSNGFKTKSVRKGADVKKRYVLTHARLVEMAERYAGTGSSVAGL